MAKFRKKPVVIEAWHWLFNPDQEPPPPWMDDALNRWPEVGGVSFEPEQPDGPRIAIATLEGVMVGMPGDWIIQGVQGELYACKPDIFAATYEPVEEPPEE